MFTEAPVARRSVSRVLSRPRAGMAIHLGRSLPNASRDRPERRRGRPARQRQPKASAACRSYLVLLPVGFTLPPPLPAARCALTAPFHPCRPAGLAAPHGLGGVFLWHFPWGRPRRALPGTVLPWSPDFPPPAKRGERPSDRLAGIIWDAAPRLSNPPRLAPNSELSRAACVAARFPRSEAPMIDAEK